VVEELVDDLVDGRSGRHHPRSRARRSAWHKPELSDDPAELASEAGPLSRRGSALLNAKVSGWVRSLNSGGVLCCDFDSAIEYSCD
jgi:hypothetical protein